MPTYTMTVEQTVREQVTVTVDAKNREEAEEAAIEASLHEEEWGFVSVDEREVVEVPEITP